MGKGGGGGASALPMMFAMQALQASQKQTADLAKAMSDKPAIPTPAPTPEIPTPKTLPATNTDNSKRQTTILTGPGTASTEPTTRSGGILGSLLTGALGSTSGSSLLTDQDALKKKMGA